MRVSDYVAQWLRKEGIAHVFNLPGGMISPLLDSIETVDGVRLLTLHHEQGVAFAVKAVGLLTGRPALGLATVGPGALNLFNGIVSAYFDSVPALFITGQVQTYLQKGDRPVRQFGFQECDVVAMVGGITKGAWQVRKPGEVPELLDRALALATEGRPGPVLIDIPMDLQGAPLTVEPGPPASPAVPERPPREVVDEVLEALDQAERPLILAGGGIRAAGALRTFRNFARQAGVPVITTILALDALPADDPLRVGMIGMYGNRWANLAMVESDLILVLGSRLDPGQTSADVADWKRGRRVFHVDCDPTELDLRVSGCRTIQHDVGAFLRGLVEGAGGRGAAPRDAWSARIEELRARHPDTAELEGCDGINPNLFVHRLSAASQAAAAYVVDAGQHTWWTSQSVRLTESQRFLAATGLGPMGFSLPAGIGAAVAGGEPVLVMVGDGALQINIQELQTIVRYRLPVKIVVFNNQCHGMVRQFQESAFDGRYPATVWGYDTPDFARVAEAYGIAGRTLREPDDVDAAIAWLWNEPDQPALLQLDVPQDTNVYPIVPFGLPITEMESFNKP